MKKLNLKLGGIKEMLSREQMKKVVGGDGYGYGGGYSNSYNYYCKTSKGNSFTCDDCAAVMQSWVGFWEASGYTVDCNTSRIYSA